MGRAVQQMATAVKMELFKPIHKYIEALETQKLSDDRKAVLQPLADYIISKNKANQAVQLNFICTHNSRRSHLAQVWAQTMAEYFKVPNIQCYSGGTEATAVYPMVVETLQNTGFEISKKENSKNPIYSIKFTSEKKPISAFSKKYDDKSNPKSGFAAIMTCSDADENCPIVFGADERFPIRYEDPKKFDDTDLEEIKYDERCREIAREMLFTFSLVNQ